MNKTLKDLEGWRRYRRLNKPWNYGQEIPIWRYGREHMDREEFRLSVKILCAVAGSILGALFLFVFFASVARADVVIDTIAYV